MSVVVKPVFREFPINVDRAEGPYIISEGRKLLDFSGSAMTTGYIEIEWLPPVPSLVVPNSYSRELERRLRNISGMQRVLFATSGGEACDAELSMYGRPILSLQGAYHGLTYLTRLVSNGSGFNIREKVLHLKVPSTDLPVDVAINTNESLLRKYLNGRRKRSNRSREGVEQEMEGSITVELVQSDGGVNILPEDFIRFIVDTAREYNLSLIVDEVYTGMGRSGEILLSKRYGLKPSALCLGKGMASGLPMGAAAYDRSWDVTINGLMSMSAGNMLSAKASLEVLNSLTEDRLAFVRRQGERAKDYLKDTGNSRVREVRGLGFIMGIEFRDSSGRPSPGYTDRLRRELLKQGVLLTITGHHNNVLKITPPVMIGEGERWDGLEKIRRVISHG